MSTQSAYKALDALKHGDHSIDTLSSILSCRDTKFKFDLYKAAYSVMEEAVGDKIYYRGLLEYSNYCQRDCFYCGIRKSNAAVSRYQLSEDEILGVAKWCADNHYGSLTLQGGERLDEKGISFLLDIIPKIKEVSRTASLAEGLGITLCVGEHDETTYQRFFDAGAHRYLLRIESSNPDLYKKIHPETDSLDRRLKSLRLLRELGFQVGTGVMIGLPSQTIEDLAEDINFYLQENIDMIGMGPYIVHQQTPMAAWSRDEYQGFPFALDKNALLDLTLAMISISRILIPRANIAATTALQTIHPFGREMGLKAGANVLMPLVTPTQNRKQYQLYDGKPCLDDQTDECRDCLLARVGRIDRSVAWDDWGDPLHYFDRLKEEAGA
jgi:biotin synthase